MHFAGILDRHQMDEVTIELWDMVMNVNLRGTFLIVQALAPIMKGQRSGRIVLTASDSDVWDHWLAVLRTQSFEGRA